MDGNYVLQHQNPSQFIENNWFHIQSYDCWPLRLKSMQNVMN